MKRKLLQFLLFILIFPFLSGFPLKIVSAQQNRTCEVEYVRDQIRSATGDPVDADSSSTRIAIGINTTGFGDEDLVIQLAPTRLGRQGGNIWGNSLLDGSEKFKSVDGKIIIPIVNFKASTSNYDGEGTFPIGDYTLKIRNANSPSVEAPFLCEAKFKIEGPTGGTSEYCDIQFTKPADEFDNEGYLGFKVKFLVNDYSTIIVNPPEDDTYMHRVYIKNEFGQIINPDNLSKYSTSALIKGVTLKERLSNGEYTMEVRERAEDLIFGNEGRSCPGSFGLGANGGPGCVGGLAGDRQCKSLGEKYDDYLCLPNPDDKGRLSCRLPEAGEGHNPCNPDNKPDGPYTCNTAIGPISTDPGGFIKNVLVLILSLSGGIIILLIIVNGYKLMVSQGDPEKVKEAREGVTSAIAGLLLIIFSLAILQFITHDVLHLPGFGS